MKKREIAFGEIFSKTIEDYKRNFKSIFLFMIIFYGIFSLFSFVISTIWILNDGIVENFVVNAHISNQNIADVFPWQYVIVTWILGIIGILISLFVGSGLINVSVRKEKFSFRELVTAGRNSFFNYLSFSIVLVVFLIGLFLLLIVPGIIFMVYWILGSYVFFYEKKDILQSLKKSRELVTGNWWKIFGYMILVFIILSLVLIIVSVVVQPTQIIQMINLFTQQPVSLKFFMIHSFLGIIAGFISNLLYVPFSILFFKNVYLRLRG